MDLTNNTFTETSTDSYCERIGQSFKSMCFGGVLIFVAIGVLIWNEGDTVQTQRSLDEAESMLVEGLNATTVNAVNEGQLIHLTADLDTPSSSLADSVFGVTAQDMLKLRRQATMYQWKESSRTETKTNTGGSQTKQTVYEYKAVWSSLLINSNNFRNNPDGRYNNPTSMPYMQQEWEADPINMGAFTLSNDLVDLVNWYSSRSSLNMSVANIPNAELRNKTTLLQQGQPEFYIGTNPSMPTVGDQRIEYSSVVTDTVSVVAQQTGSVLTSFPTEAGKDVLLLERGVHTAEAMFDQAEAAKQARAWFLRAIGFGLMYGGFCMLGEPLSTFTDVLPFLGRMVGGAIACLMFPIAAILSLLVIGLAWIAYRPILGGSILAVVVAITVGCCCYVKQQGGNNPTPHAANTHPAANNNNNNTYANNPPPMVPATVVNNKPDVENGYNNNNEADIPVANAPMDGFVSGFGK